MKKSSNEFSFFITPTFQYSIDVKHVYRDKFNITAVVLVVHLRLSQVVFDLTILSQLYVFHAQAIPYLMMEFPAMFHVDKILVDRLNMISHRCPRMLQGIDLKSFIISVVE